MTRRALLSGAAAMMAVFAGQAAQAQDQTPIGVVAQIGGISWFNALEAGIEEKA